jgi:hypothetical protein
MRLARIALLAWLAGGIVVSAHHSTLPFDGTRPTVITGVVSAFKWAYPHTLIVLDVGDAGGTRTRWTVESESLAMLSRLGWTKNSITPGERIRVTGARARNGDPALRCRTIDMPDGTTLACFPIEEGP